MIPDSQQISGLPEGSGIYCMMKPGRSRLQVDFALCAVDCLTGNSPLRDCSSVMSRALPHLNRSSSEAAYDSSRKPYC
jgi:hypothetical protein